MSKKRFLFSGFLLLALLGSRGVFAQQNAHPAAVLELDSTTKGFLMPRLSTTQRDAISNPADGLWLFNTSNQQFNVYNSSSNEWKVLEVAGVAAAPATVLASFTEAANGNFTAGSAVSGSIQLVITNNSSSNVVVNFAPTDITLSGVSGVSIISVSDSVETITPSNSHTVNYTLGGSPTAAGILTARYSYSTLSATARITVDSN